VFGIVQSHNGFIDVQSIEGEGSTFSFFFPVVVIEKPQEVQVNIESLDSLKGSETILVVEDEDALREYISRELASYGYNIISAQDSWEALSIFRQNVSRIDLVLTDMGLPRISGEQLSYQIKQLQPQKPVVVASGYIDPAVAIRLQKAGVRHMLNKPYQISVLLKTLRLALSGN
jgi:two-component system, cell cycle sensor histidine kinase and response regulator CckA